MNNAKIFKEIQKEYGSFFEYLKQYWNGETIYDCVSTKSELSDRISADLCKRGMKFMGTTIVHSFLQAIGVIDAHDETCDMHREPDGEHEKSCPDNRSI